MTKQHCTHECVCPDYKASHSGWEDEEDAGACTLSCYHRSDRTDQTDERRMEKYQE